jgi:hypothetical protein
MARIPRKGLPGFYPTTKGNRCFIKIPKCGTTTITKVLVDREGWATHREPWIDTDWDMAALVRHPVDRWISGMAQYLHNGQRHIVSVDQAIEKMEHDTHTSPQSKWMQGAKPWLFKLENIQRLWDWWGISSRVHLRQRSDPALELTTAHKDKIIEHYANDLVMWEQAL